MHYYDCERWRFVDFTNGCCGERVAVEARGQGVLCQACRRLVLSRMHACALQHASRFQRWCEASMYETLEHASMLRNTTR